MYILLKIKRLSSWADIEISSGNSRFAFSASQIGHSSFTTLLRAIIQTWKGQSSSGNVRFDMEAEGWLDILFINYPGGILKIEVYHSVDWYKYDDILEEYPLPVPVFAAITNHHNIAYEIIKALEMYDRKDFDCWQDSFFDNELPELKRMIKS